MIAKFKTVVLGTSIVMPLAGIIRGINQIEHCKQQKNYLNGGNQVTVIRKQEITYKPINSSIERKVTAYQIEGVNGWFSADDFQKP